MRGVELDRPMDLGEAAAMFKMPRRRLWRWLTRWQAEGKEVMTRANDKGRWQVTVTALRMVWNDVGKRPVTRDDVRDLKTELRLQTEALKNFRSKANMWFRRIDELEKRLEQAFQLVPVDASGRLPHRETLSRGPGSPESR